MLSFDDVSVRYADSDPPAVDRLSFTVGPGERLALVGPSGAGKSTVLRLAAGLTLPAAGRVETLGVDTSVIGRRTHRDERRRIGLITQDFALVGPLSVASNVAAGRLGAAGWFGALKTLVRPGPITEIAAALESVGIAEKLWERSDRLSGGQQQRTAIARSLFQVPELLLADEPVSALDPARSDAVMATLAETCASSGRSMVASMHDAPLALRHCTRVIALRRGRVVFDLASDEVGPDLLHELYLLDNTAAPSSRRAGPDGDRPGR